MASKDLPPTKNLLKGLVSASQDLSEIFSKKGNNAVEALAVAKQEKVFLQMCLLQINEVEEKTGEAAKEQAADKQKSKTTTMTEKKKREEKLLTTDELPSAGLLKALIEEMDQKIDEKIKKANQLLEEEQAVINVLKAVHELNRSMMGK
jgi:hypothetical protein